jgi:hypothetical protein
MNTCKFYITLFILAAAQLFPCADCRASRLISNDTVSSFKYPAKNDAVIISEKDFIEVIGAKTDLINYSVTKKVRIKVLTKAGIERFSTVTLPEPFDQTYISHFPADRNYTCVFSEMKCTGFSATIVTDKGVKKEAKISQAVKEVRMVMVEKERYGTFQKFIYHIGNLEIGDEVNIEYSYLIPYFENFATLSSMRLFFHGDVLKQNYQLTLKLHATLNHDINYYNNGNPDSVYTIDNKKVYFWNKTNLQGCLHEDGGRPYLSLPYLIFTIKPNGLFYTLPYSFEERYYPFYALYSYKREKNHLNIAKTVSQGVNIRQYNLIDDFIASQTRDIKGDSLGYVKLMKIQTTIAEDFKFDNDVSSFKNDDVFDPTMGEDLIGRALQDISRYDTYVALIMKLGLNYFTAYLCDNRMGEISNQYFAPMLDSDYLFGIILPNNTMHYLYPKKSRFGYYLNEVPFYFENSKARLVSLNDYRTLKDPVNEGLRQSTLPGSQINDNVRTSNIMVRISLDTLTAFFDARINLSGQYSTLTRGLYQYDYKDETINESYSRKIFELNDKVRKVSQETKITNREFPYPAVVKVRYRAGNLLKKSGDTIALDLGKWFNHIIYSDLDTSNRQLDFYPDFCGKDTYTYFIQFDKNIRLISAIEHTAIQNELGELVLNAEQVGPDAVKITSFFATTNSRVPANKIAGVKRIYDKISEMNNSRLLLKLE